MGRKLILTGTKLTDLAAPRIPDIDAIESSGSLYLFDLTHPKNPWAAGVPVNGSIVPNIFSEQAQSITGSPAAAGGTFELNGLTGVNGLVERTSKGGLHVITSPTNNLTAGSDFVNISASSGFAAYLQANRNRTYYASLWFRNTRAASGTSESARQYIGYTGSAPLSNMLVSLTSQQSARGQWGARPSAGHNSLGNILASVGPQGMSGTNTLNRVWPFSAGNTGAYNSVAGNLGKNGSYILYRAYLEDLTLSGRTYAQVDAIDLELFTQQVLTPGGRYYGDTFTAPSAIA